MKPALHRFGMGQHPVVVVDEFTGNIAAIREIAAALAPFPANQGNYYPGLRRFITPADSQAYAYAHQLLSDAAALIGGGFDFDTFDWLEGSFSMVTTPPEQLTPPQRAPHFDSPDPGYLAVLHYLSDTPGTAFYRQRMTGIERVTNANLDRFVESARPAAAAARGYIHGSDIFYEQIGMVEGKADRLVIYRGSMLHSGIIPPGIILNDDPRYGRLTANLFVQGR
jgi:Family of unknown function (DUF6445)